MTMQRSFSLIAYLLRKAQFTVEHPETYLYAQYLMAYTPCVGHDARRDITKYRHILCSNIQ